MKKKINGVQHFAVILLHLIYHLTAKPFADLETIVNNKFRGIHELFSIKKKRE